MTEVYSDILHSKIQVNRILGKVVGVKPGGTVVFFGGIHGNENAGVLAISDVLKCISEQDLCGVVYGIAGNLKALEFQQRYLDTDLNRLWTNEQINTIKNKTLLNVEETELLEILELLNTILKTNKPPFYFIDLHTTSSKTLPFITINDALINRKFSKQFPVPVVLGIEEYLNGPLLSYINELGYVSLGFESGQHNDLKAITNSIAFMYLALVFSGVLKMKGVINFNKYYKELKSDTHNVLDIFEVVYMHKIEPYNKFEMLDGFESFQRIKKGKVVAFMDEETIITPNSGRIFMPLYQQKGAEGFFIIKTIKPFFLKLSALLRNTKTDSLLAILPGVSWVSKAEGLLQVNLKTAKFLAKSIFHLLGYRSNHLTATHLLLTNRERVAKTSIYKKAPWY